MTSEQQVYDTFTVDREEAAQALDRIEQREAALEAALTQLREALTTLVALKDGPRDSAYYEEKPKAWERARALTQENPE